MKRLGIPVSFIASLLFSAAIFAQTVDDHMNSGRKKLQAGDYDGAIAEYNQAISLAPKNVAAFNARGAAKRRKGDLAAAIVDYDNALAIDPKSGLALSDRGFSRLNLGDLEGAEADFNLAFELAAKKNADRYNPLGLVKQLRGDLRGALADYDKAIEAGPEAPGYPRIYRETLLLQQGKASSDFAPTIDSWGEGWPKITGRYVAGKLDETAFLAAAAKGDAKSVRDQQCRAFYFVGKIRLIAGDNAQARDWFTRCIATEAVSLNEYSLARAELARAKAGADRPETIRP